MNSEVLNEIMRSDSINIYGAGLMGKALMKCLTENPYNKKINSFIVKNIMKNPSDVEGIPVIDIEAAYKQKESLILVALHEKYMKDALHDLKIAGFTNIISVSFDCDLWTEIRKGWMREHPNLVQINISPLEEALKNQLCIYVVHSDADKKLLEDVTDEAFEIPIQVGAALTNNHLYEVRDDIGDDNISKKNRQYCELTALYWIWKNGSADYLGLSHYRRRFAISGQEKEKLLNSDVDVVVTTPVINFNTVRRQYELDHDIHDWDIMMEAIKVLYPEYIEVANKVSDGICYYAYNMFIAKKTVFKGYCKWLFDILDYCEKRISEKEDSYQKRFAGFLAERLMTIYFTHNNQYKLAVIEKHFIESE